MTIMFIINYIYLFRLAIFLFNSLRRLGMRYLLSLIIMVCMSQAQANEIVIIGSGSIGGVNNLLCKVRPEVRSRAQDRIVSERQESTILRAITGAGHHFIGIKEEVISLKHQVLKADGCNEQKLSGIISEAHDRFMNAPVTVRVKRIIKNDYRNCIKRITEELEVGLGVLSELVLKSTAYGTATLLNCGQF